MVTHLLDKSLKLVLACSTQTVLRLDLIRPAAAVAVVPNQESLVRHMLSHAKNDFIAQACDSLSSFKG
jgi:hypothetical protein